MTAPAGHTRRHSRASRIGLGILALIYAKSVVLGSAALYLSFRSTYHTSTGHKYEDVVFATLFSAGIGAALAVEALVITAVAAVLRWWRPYWAIPAAVLLTVCLIRMSTAFFDWFYCPECG